MQQATGRRKSGEEFLLKIAITSFVVELHRFFTAFMHDISDRIKVEQTRDEGERTLLDVVETSPVAVDITDRVPAGSSRWDGAAMVKKATPISGWHSPVPIYTRTCWPGSNREARSGTRKRH